MFGDHRPKLDLKKTNPEKWTEWSTVIIIALTFIYPAIYYSDLPDQVPKHFNLSGKADSYGDKTFVWLMPIISLVLGYGIYYLNKFPHLFNYPTEVTKDNAEKLYRSALNMLRIINLVIALLFLLVTYQVVSMAISGAEKSSTTTEYLFYILIGGLTIGPLIAVIVMAIKKE